METTKTVLNPATLWLALTLYADKTAEGVAAKGDTLRLAHAMLDAGGLDAAKALDSYCAAQREQQGGKGAPKPVQAAYKLGKRYAACALILLAHGRTFADIGMALTDKKGVTINLVEQIARNLGDETATYHLAALQWRDAKGDYVAYMSACDACDTLTAQDNADIHRQAVAAQASELIASKDAEIVALKAQLRAANKSGDVNKGKGKASIPGKPGELASLLMSVAV